MVENYSKDILQDGTLPADVKLSEATLNKFAEINGSIDEATEAILEQQIEKENPEDSETKSKSSNLSSEQIRKKDEGLNEDGTVKDLEETSSNEKPDELEKEKQLPPKPKVGDFTPALPNRLIQAAYRNHLTDEDISKLGERAESVLSAMADNADKISTELGELGRLRKEAMLKGKEQKSEPAPKEAPETDSDDDPVIKLINKGFAQLNQRIDAVEHSRATVIAADVDKKVDNFFDGKAKDFPQLGNSTTLSQFQFGIRKAIYNVADDIFVGAHSTGKPVTLETALEAAFSMYEKEGNIKKQVRDEIIKDVKNREMQKTARPSQRKTQELYQEPIKAAQDKVRKFWAKKGVNADLEPV